MRPYRKKRVSFRFYILIALALCLIGYGGYVAVTSLMPHTAVIEAGAGVSQYQAEAVIVRQETLVDAESVTSVTYYADEGQLVYKGNRIAAVYSGATGQTDMSKLLNVRAKIKGYHKQLSTASYTDPELKRIGERVLDYTRELERMVRGERGNLLNLQRQLEAEMARRQAYLKAQNGADQNLMSLYSEESILSQKINSWTNVFLAEEDSIISFYTDGYENVLDTGDFDNISAAQVRAILSGEAPALSAVQRGRSAVFRRIRPTGWYLLLISRDPNWNPTPGNLYMVLLDGFEQAVEATVTSASRSGSELLVRMAVGGDVRPVLNIRASRAQVSEGEVSGFRVPLRARHEQNGEVGIVLVDGGGTFVPVDIIAMDGDFYIVKPRISGILKEGQKIMLF